METISIEFTKEQVKRLYENYGDKNTDLDIYVLAKKALDQIDAPQIGDRCAFWDDNKNLYRIGVLTEMKGDYASMYRKDNGTLWKNCAKIKKEAEF